MITSLVVIAVVVIAAIVAITTTPASRTSPSSSLPLLLSPSPPLFKGPNPDQVKPVMIIEQVELMMGPTPLKIQAAQTNCPHNGGYVGSTVRPDQVKKLKNPKSYSYNNYKKASKF